MKAAFITAPRKFEIREIDIPTINDNQLLVKVEACGVCTSDIPPYLDTLSDEVKKRNPFPRRVGHEPSGTVQKVGKNIKDFQVGDRITGNFNTQSFAEYVTCEPGGRLFGNIKSRVVKIPAGVPMEHALGEPMMSVMAIARVTTPEIGDYVFQVGCGFMGLGVMAGVASPKLKEYIACDLDDSRLQLAKEMGATITLNPSKVDVVREVMKITSRRGVDVAIEAVGYPAGLKLANAVIKWGRGKIISMGWHQTPATYELYDWIRSPIVYSPQGIGMSLDPDSELPRAMWAIEKGIYPMTKLVTHKYRLEEIDKAFSDNLGRTPGYIKGVVMI